MSSTSESVISWIKWYCGQKGHEFLVEVDDDYVQDKFNLTGLSEQVPQFNRAIEIITDMESDDDDEEDDEVDSKKARERSDLIDQASLMLYQLVHARFINSSRGMQMMAGKFKNGEFGQCPRLFCEGQNVLPVGLSDVSGEGNVKMYCPKCRDVYYPKLKHHQSLDGAHFGTGFPHMLLFSFPELRPAPPTMKYEAKLFGFKIHPLAYKGQKVEAAKPATLTKQQDLIGGGSTSTNANLVSVGSSPTKAKIKTKR